MRKHPKSKGINSFRFEIESLNEKIYIFQNLKNVSFKRDEIRALQEQIEKLQERVVELEQS